MSGLVCILAKYFYPIQCILPSLDTFEYHCALLIESKVIDHSLAFVDSSS